MPFNSKKRFVFFSMEVPKFQESEVNKLSEFTDEESKALSSKELVDAANESLNKHQTKFRELPDSAGPFKKRIHDEVVDYFNNSVGSFDKDGNYILTTKEKGKEVPEFVQYRTSMLNQLNAILKKYAPTDEQIALMKEQKEQGKKALEAAEKLEPLNIEEVTDNPGEINNGQELEQKFYIYQTWNVQLQQEASAAMKPVAPFHKSYSAFSKARAGLESWKQAAAYIDPAEDEERIKLQNKLSEIKSNIENSIQKISKVKNSFNKYGEVLAEKSNQLKQKQLDEKEATILRLQHLSNTNQSKLLENEGKFKRMSDQQVEFEKQQEKIQAYYEQISTNKKQAGDATAHIAQKASELNDMKSHIANSRKKIILALENPDLSEEAKNDLKVQLNMLGNKEKVLALGANAATDLLRGGEEKQREFLQTEFNINNRQQFLQNQLEEYVLPALAGLQFSAEVLKKEKIKFATKESDIEAYYTDLFTRMDMTDQHLDSTILENDLATESLLGSLKEQKKALDQINIQPPNGLYGAYQSSFGVMFGTIGGAFNWVAESMIDQSTWLADVSQSNYEERKKTFWGSVGYVAGRIGSTVVEIFPTVTGAAAGLIGGVFTMAGEPAEAWKGVKMLFGPNYKEAWSEMGKALIAYEDFEKGRYGVGIGKFFVNVGTVLIPAAGPIGTGAKAARASMAGANKVTAATILRAGGVGLKEAGVAAAAGIRTTALSGYRSIGDFAHALKMNPLQFIKGGFVIAGRSFKSVFYESIAGKFRTPEQILQNIIKGVREKHPNITDSELTVYLRERYPQFFTAEREWLAVRQMADEIKALNEERVIQRVYSLLRDQYARQHPNLTRDELLNLLKNDKPELYAKYERLNHLDSQMAPILMAENRANGLLRSAMRDPDKMNMLLEKLGNGEMHLTTDMVNYFLTDSNNAAKLKTVLGKPDLKLSSTVNYERLVQEIRLLKYRELKAVSSPRQMTDDITQILVKIRRGQKIDINDDLGQVFLRLKEKNPEFFKKLIDAPLEEMAQTETIEGILRNNKYIDQNVNGLEVVGFFGKELGAGGMGAVNEFAYYVGKNGRIKFGAIKKAHASSGVISDTFAEEIANVPNVRRLKTKHILKPLDNGEKFIIFESGTNKYSMYTCENHLTPAEALKAHQQMMGVTKEYFRNGFFHGDEKWDQWVRLSKEGQPIDTYHVDNSPIPFKVAGEFGETWAATPQYSISYHSIPQYKTRLANSGIIDPVTQAEYIGRTADAYSHLIVAEELLAKYSGRLPAHAIQEMINLKNLTDLTISTRTHRIAIQNWNQLHWIREDWTKLDVVRLGDPKFMDELIAAEEALIEALNRPAP